MLLVRAGVVRQAHRLGVSTVSFLFLCNILLLPRSSYTDHSISLTSKFLIVKGLCSRDQGFAQVRKKVNKQSQSTRINQNASNHWRIEDSTSTVVEGLSREQAYSLSEELSTEREDRRTARGSGRIASGARIAIALKADAVATASRYALVRRRECTRTPGFRVQESNAHGCVCTLGWEMLSYRRWAQGFSIMQRRMLHCRFFHGFSSFKQSIFSFPLMPGTSVGSLCLPTSLARGFRGSGTRCRLCFGH